MEGTMHGLTARNISLLRKLAWGTATALLVLPAVAMQFTREVNWTGGDFLAMGVILFGCCALLEVAIRMSRNSTPYLVASVLGIGTGFLTLWITLAVGIIGSENEAANLAFLAVLAIALLGSVASLCRPRGMAVAMTATAATQAATALYALWLGSMEGAVISLVFAAAWFVAGVLYRKAAQEQAA